MCFMSLLSKAEIQYLQGQKAVSKSYEYKLKSIIKKKLGNLMDKELPLLSFLFPNLDLTKISKIQNTELGSNNLTKISNPNISLIGASEFSSASDNHHKIFQEIQIII